MSIALDDLWTPKPTQQAFLDAIRDAPPLTIPAYIGAVGSGKTSVICRAALGLAFAHPGLRMLVGRFNYTELRDTTLNTFFDMVRLIEESVRDRLPANRRSEFSGIGTFNKGVGDYQVFNGSTLLFRHLEDGHRRFKSLEIGAFGVDEASEVEGNQDEPPTILMLQARLRQKGMPLVGFLVSNPTGFDHWLYRWYGHGVTERHGIGKKGYPVVRTNMRENLENLPPGYEDKLRLDYPAAWVRRYIEGEWGGIDEGAPIFPTFSVATHVRPLEWLRRQHVHVGIDWGYNAPGVVWGQIDPGPSKRFHVLRSWDPKNLDVYKLAQGVRARNDEWFPGGRFAYYCLAANTPVLSADFAWKPLGDFKVGERLLSIDEHGGDQRHGGLARRWRQSEVTFVHRSERTCLELTMASGRTLVTTPDHQMLKARIDAKGRWVEAGTLRIGDRLTVGVEPWTAPVSVVAAEARGWMGGFLDGEGYVSGTRLGAGKAGIHSGFGALSYGQLPGSVFDLATQIATDYGFSVTLRAPRVGVCTGRFRGNVRSTIRALGLFPAIRLRRNLLRVIDTGHVRALCLGTDRIVKIINVGIQPVVDIKTTTRTFVANGYVVHNCGHDGNAKKDTNSKSSAEVFGEYGMAPHVRFTSLERGFSTLRSLLVGRDDGRPGLLVAPCNPVLIEGLQGGYRYHPDKEDEPIKTGRYDPLIDALRYIVVNLYTTSGQLPNYHAIPAFQGFGGRRA